MDEELCSTCLSKQRNLIPLSAMKGISLDLKTILGVVSAFPLCWECRAVLLRMQMFIDQASTAQELMKQYRKNKKLPTTLQSLSKLSISITTNYDEIVVYPMKCESVDSEGVNDFRSATKCDGDNRDDEEHLFKIEKIDDEFQESFYMSEFADVSMSAEDSDEKPLATGVRLKKAEHKSGVSKKTAIPKRAKVESSDTIEKCRTKTSKEEEEFIIKRIPLKEVFRLREEDRKIPRYVSCPFKCETCITGYYSEEKYTNHMGLRHSEEIGPYSCDICHRRFKLASALAHHRDTHLRSYQCSKCEVASHRLRTMLAHSANHKLQQFSCKQCGVSFLKDRQLRYHKEKMHKELRACGTCGKRFVNPNSLLKHEQTVHGPAARQACPACGRAVRDVRAHLATHAPPAADALCVECPRAFRTRQAYRRHLLAHRNHRDDALALKFKCSVCPQRFSGKTGLQRHEAAIHTKQYPFTCPHCAKGFGRPDRLKYHILERHEGGQRPREKVCSYCGKAFKTKGVLIHHIRTHTGEKPYQCQFCPWSFAQRSTLTTHTRALHGNTSGSGNTGGGGKTDK